VEKRRKRVEVRRKRSIMRSRKKRKRTFKTSGDSETTRAMSAR